MENFQKIHIEGKEYFIIDSIQNLRAEDSFIYRKNKLQMYKGNGESRKYVGSYLGSSGERLSDFFEYEKIALISAQIRFLKSSRYSATMRRYIASTSTDAMSAAGSMPTFTMPPIALDSKEKHSLILHPSSRALVCTNQQLRHHHNHP